MGCGASVKKDATAEQKEKLCIEACKNMMVICVEHVINVEVIQNKSKDIQIEAPGQQVKQIKEFVLSLRKAAEDAKEKADKTAKDAEAKAAEAGASAGGMMGGLGLGGAGAALAGAATAGAALAGQGAAAVAGAAGSGADTVLTAAADTLQGKIDAVEAEFSGVAQELVSAKKVEIFDIYNKIIGACVFQSATGLVRGAAPHTATEYAAVKPGTIGLAFNNASAKQLEEALLPAVQEEINKSKVVKAWDASIEKYNSGNEALSKNELLAKFKSEPIKLDINTYIVAEVVKKLGVLMGKREDEVRKAPQNMAQRQPRTFEKCFSGDRLTENEFKDFEAGK